MTGGLVRTTFYLFLLCLALLLGYTIWTADISKTARFFLLGLAIVLRWIGWPSSYLRGAIAVRVSSCRIPSARGTPRKKNRAEPGGSVRLLPAPIGRAISLETGPLSKIGPMIEGRSFAHRARRRNQKPTAE